MEMTREERYLLKKRIFCAPLERRIVAAENPKALAASHVVRKVASVLSMHVDHQLKFDGGECGKPTLEVM
jgi:hypothetical protein